MYARPGPTGRTLPWEGASRPRSTAGEPCRPSRVRARISESLRRERGIYTTQNSLLGNARSDLAHSSDVWLFTQANRVLVARSRFSFLL
jgi:hypothetical protein